MSKEHYRPLPSSLTIHESNLSNKTGKRELGIFATQDIPEGACLGITHYQMSDWSAYDLIRTPLGGFINHGNTPNCKLLQDISKTPIEFRLHTLNDIKEGDEIVLKYTQYNPED